MTNLILRVDDRGIHGQVTVGWLERLNIKILILATEPNRRELPKEAYALSIPEGVQFFLFTPEEIIKNTSRFSDKQKTMIICRSLATAYLLINKGLKVKEVNLGGLHSEKGREILKFVRLAEGDLFYLKKLLEKGIAVLAYELPEDKPIDMRKLI